MRRFLFLYLLFFGVYFFGWLFVYKTDINVLAIQSEDTLPAIFLPVSIIKDKTFYVDNYYSMLVSKYPHPDDKNQTKGLTPYYLRKVSNPKTGTSHYVSAFPVMAGIVSLPIYFFPLILGLPVNWENLVIISHIASSFIVSLSGVFFYLLARKFVNKRAATFLSFIFIFGTVNFAMISQSLWQHGVLQLFTIISLIFLFKFRETLNLRYIFWFGFFAGFSIISRPTAVIAVFYLFLLLLLFSSKKFWDISASIKLVNFKFLAKPVLFFVLGLIPAVSFFVWYNNHYFFSFANQGYFVQAGKNWLTPFPFGFLGIWFSPSKGILVYSPVFMFVFLSVYLVFKNYKAEEKFTYFMFFCIVLSHTLILGSWKHWYGGYSFGYRMASDVIPFLCLLLIPYLKSYLHEKTKFLFYFLVILSVFIEFMGLAFFDGVWHGTFDKGFWNQSWLWDIKNSELIFNLRRILVKFNL